MSLGFFVNFDFTISYGTLKYIEDIGKAAIKVLLSNNSPIIFAISGNIKNSPPTR